MERRLGRRTKILRKPGGPDYPLYVCEPCGRSAVSTSNTKAQEDIDFRLGSCPVCKRMLIHVATPWDFGYPTFYTYANGQPVEGT